MGAIMKRILIFFVLFIGLTFCATTARLPKGVMGMATTVNCTPPNIAYTIHLQRGWNLISVPVNDIRGNNVSTLLPVGVLGAWSYNAITHYYYTVTNFEPCVGYWIFAMNDTDIELCGDPIYECCYNLSKGWNLIGAPYPTSRVPSRNLSTYGYSSGSYYATSSLNPGEGYLMSAIEPTYLCIGNETEEECDITECTYITTSGYHALCKDIVMTTGEWCLKPLVDNVVLDCRGHSIIGSDHFYGVNIQYARNITVINCKISNFTTGIRLWNYANNNRLINNTITRNSNGVVIEDSSFILLENNTIYANHIGIFNQDLTAFESVNNTYRNNNINNNLGNGLEIRYSANNTIINNKFDSNGRNGIILVGTHNDVIINNTANSNGEAGIYLFGYDYPSYQNTLINNTANSNRDGGIILDNFALNNILINNTVEENLGSGITLFYDSSHNTLFNNIVRHNHQFGIYVALYSNYNNITKNIVNSNKYGIRIIDSSNNIVEQNIVNLNGYNGILLYWASSNNLINNIVCSNHRTSLTATDVNDTYGTSNIWRRMVCDSSLPYGLCSMPCYEKINSEPSAWKKEHTTYKRR